MFTTNHNGGGPHSLLDQIPEGESLDFAVPNNKIILATGVGAATDHIEGIYDFLD